MLGNSFLKGLLKSSVTFEDNKNFKASKCEFDGKIFNIYVPKKKASKNTIIHLSESGDVVWEEMYMFGGMSLPRREKSFLMKPEVKKGEYTIAVLRGVPNYVEGLDEKIFISATIPYSKGKIYFLKEDQVENLVKSLEKLEIQ